MKFEPKSFSELKERFERTQKPDPKAIYRLKENLEQAQKEFEEELKKPIVIPDYEDVLPCRDCGHPMTDTERYFYEYRCESCETAHSDRITAWRTGQVKDPELDEMFSIPSDKPVLH